jgi:hypothetical protein
MVKWYLIKYTIIFNFFKAIVAVLTNNRSHVLAALNGQLLFEKAQGLPTLLTMPTPLRQ